MRANSSTSDCTDEASRVEIRSTPEEARLDAMASPFETNSSVMAVLMDRAETYHVTAARGTRTATRKITIFPRRPRPRRAGCPAVCSSSGSFLVRAMTFSCGSGANGRGPIGDGHPVLALHPGEVDAVEPLVTLRSEAEGGPYAEVDVVERLEGLAQACAGRIGAGPAQRLHGDLGVDEAFEADEAVALGRVAAVPQRFRQGRIVLVHEGPVFGDAGEAEIVVARHYLGIDEGARVVAPRRLALLEEKGEHRVGSDEGDIRDRHRKAHVARGADEGAAALIGARAQDDLTPGLAQHRDRGRHIVVEPGPADVGRLGRDLGASLGERALRAIGAAPAVGVYLIEEAELPGAQPPEALDERGHLLTVRGADIEDVVDVGRLPLRLGPREVTHEEHVAVALDDGEGPRQGRRSHVVRQEEHLVLLHELYRVAQARVGLITVVERRHHDGATIDAAAGIDLREVCGGAPPQLGAQTRGGTLERRAHADLDVARADAGRARRGHFRGRGRGRLHAGTGRRLRLSPRAVTGSENSPSCEDAGGQTEETPPVHVTAFSGAPVSPPMAVSKARTSSSATSPSSRPRRATITARGPGS